MPLPLLLFLALVVVGGLLLAGCRSSPRGSIAESQIRANIPDLTDFDRLFRRDLEAYFSDPGKPVTVEYELLRKSPSQVGVGSPKIYAWVKVFRDGALVEEGAVRVGAVEKKEFVVINYLTKEEIAQDPERVSYYFPRDAVEAIGEKMRRDAR